MLTFSDGLTLHQAMVTELAANYGSTDEQWLFKISEGFHAYCTIRGVQIGIHCAGAGQDFTGKAGDTPLTPGDLTDVLAEAAVAVKAQLQAEAAAITSAVDAL